MKEIKCVFSTSQLVDSKFVCAETTVYYRDSIAVNFDLTIDFLKLFWSARKHASYIDFSVFIEGNRLSRKLEMKLKGMIDSIISHCDGGIPLTELQTHILISKVKSIRNSALRDHGQSTEE